jgi:hypothetical protein
MDSVYRRTDKINTFFTSDILASFHSRVNLVFAGSNIPMTISILLFETVYAAIVYHKIEKFWKC